jgi:DNA-binding beta-propeller fold protein YncE
VSVGFGQTVESTIYLPDSFGGIRTPTALALDIPGNRVFVAGTRDDRILIIDGRTNRRVGCIPIGAGYCPTICYNPASRKLYTHATDGGWYCIADADSGRVILELEAGGQLAEDARRFYCDSADNRVYCLLEDGTPVGVIDGRTDSVYATQFARQPVGISWYDTTTRRWVQYRCSTVVVDSAIARAAGPLVYPTPCFNPRTGRTYEIERQQLNRLVVTEGDSVVARVLLNFNSRGCYSPRHDRLYIPDGDLLAVVELAEQRVISLLSVRGHLTAACYSSIHNRVYLADDSGSAVLVFDPDSNRVLGKIELDIHPASLFYSAVLDRLWCGLPD